ncbi:hypothetical protein [Arthrobacter sp. Br18]|uniref:hypothetical protein n=1 Tax=Arthrobacter sp. Br18 TaxID=1312954 RepID=UPI00047E5A30|nr:hypothetical protein [Arthrobacter sp. Br18]
MDGVDLAGFTYGSGTDGTDNNEYNARIAEHADDPALNPAIVVIQGGLDEASSLSVPTINAVSATLEAATEAWPAARIVVIGPAALYPENQSLLE